jgi:SSS family solute:Na+ symporter
MFQTEMVDATGAVKPDHAYPVLLNLLPVGLKGVAFAALTAAIVASLAGKANSISTIFTLDIYKLYIKPGASEKHLIRVGRAAVWISMLIAVLIAPQLRVLEQAYQFIQEYSSFVTPGVFAIFFFGMFWKRATANAALITALLTIPLSTLFKFWLPEIPFLNRMGIVFIVLAIVMVAISLLDKKGQAERGVKIEVPAFNLSRAFIIGAIIICGILTALYAAFW